MSDTPTARERAEALWHDYCHGSNGDLTGLAERAITAAVEAARGDELRKFTARGGWPNTSGTDSEREQAAFRRGAEAMREKAKKSLQILTFAGVDDKHLAIRCICQISPPQPAGGGE